MNNFETGGVPEEAKKFKAPEKPGKIKKFFKKLGVFALTTSAAASEGQAQNRAADIVRESIHGTREVAGAVADIKDANTRRRQAEIERDRIDAEERDRLARTAADAGWGSVETGSKKDPKTGKTTGASVSVGEVKGTPWERMEQNRNDNELLLQRDRLAHEREMAKEARLKAQKERMQRKGLEQKANK